MTFRITVAQSGKACLQSGERLQAVDFRAIAAELRQNPVRARKTGYVAARQALRSEPVETRWNGKETRNEARKGDWIVSNVSSRGVALRDREGHENRYVIEADRFFDLYEPAASAGYRGGAKLYRAKGTVTAISLDGGFDIVAPWGEQQIAPAGYLILNDEEVYGNNAETFEATYELLATGS